LLATKLLATILLQEREKMKVVKTTKKLGISKGEIQYIKKNAQKN
jgi:hypothetical protein